MSETHDTSPDILFINRVAEIAVLTDSRVVPVTHWFGRMGEDCAPEDATVCVAGVDGIGWYTVDLLAQHYVTVH